MSNWSKKQSFLQALDIGRGDVVCITGAGGKTSLLFLLAREARRMKLRVLVTTTTRIRVPHQGQYDRLDLNCIFMAPDNTTDPGIYVVGNSTADGEKLTGCGHDVLKQAAGSYDLMLIEADGSAGKRLKGWNSYEPVIPEFATTTIGVVDISAIGCSINNENIHRLSCFLDITGSTENDMVKPVHLQNLIEADCGLFQHAVSDKIVFFNKMESKQDFQNAEQLRQMLPARKCVAGSALHEKIYG